MDRARIEASVGRIVCSEPWARACVEAVAQGRVKSASPSALRRSGVYPPGPDARPPMGACMSRVCRWRLYPPYYLTKITTRTGAQMRLCEDCRSRYLALRERRWRRLMGEDLPSHRPAHQITAREMAELTLVDPAADHPAADAGNADLSHSQQPSESP